MIKKLLFPTAAFLILVGSIAINPKPVRAIHCNDMFCFPEMGDCLPGENLHCIPHSTGCASDGCSET